MTLTPTASSSGLAGFGFWTLLWIMVLKIEAIVELFGMRPRGLRDRILEWVRTHKTVTLIGTEVANLGMHYKALSSPNLMMFVLGGTLANVMWIFGLIPLFQAAFGRKEIIG